MPYFFVSYSPSFVVRIPPAKGFSLWLAIFCRTFAVAFETTALTSTLATGKQKSNN